MEGIVDHKCNRLTDIRMRLKRHLNINWRDLDAIEVYHVIGPAVVIYLPMLTNGGKIAG